MESKDKSDSGIIEDSFLNCFYGAEDKQKSYAIWVVYLLRVTLSYVGAFLRSENLIRPESMEQYFGFTDMPNGMA